MKETTSLFCPAGKSVIEAMAQRLFREMVNRRQANATAEFEMEDLSATIRMTIDIIF